MQRDYKRNEIQLNKQSKHGEGKTQNSRVLLISPTPVWGELSGSNLRIQQIIEILSREFIVDVLESAPITAISDPNWSTYVGGISVKTVGRESISPLARFLPGPFSARVSGGEILKVLEQTIKETNPSFIYWSESPLAYIGMKILQKDKAISHVVEFANIESKRFAKMATEGSIRSRMINFLEMMKALSWEKWVLKTCNMAVALTAKDYNYLMSRNCDVKLIENSLKIRSTDYSADNMTVLVVGSWWYEPNRTGLIKFLAKNWPNILASVPDANLVVVGRGSDFFNKKANAHISCIGYVNDLSEYYKKSALVLAPAVTGGGSQLKVSEALSHLRIVVGPPILTDSAPNDIPASILFASKNLDYIIITLLKNKEMRNGLEKKLMEYLKAREIENDSLKITELFKNLGSSFKLNQ